MTRSAAALNGPRQLSAYFCSQSLPVIKVAEKPLVFLPMADILVHALQNDVQLSETLECFLSGYSRTLLSWSFKYGVRFANVCLVGSAKRNTYKAGFHSFFFEIYFTFPMFFLKLLSFCSLFVYIRYNYLHRKRQVFPFKSIGSFHIWAGRDWFFCIFPKTWEQKHFTKENLMEVVQSYSLTRCMK